MANAKKSVKFTFPTPLTKAVVKRTSSNYGVKLSGKAGSRPELEAEYVLHFVVEDPKDGVTSLREATKSYLTAGADPAVWPRVVEAQAALERVKEKLRKAGYTQEDLLKLTLDNS